MRTESEPRSTSQRIAYKGVAEEAVGLKPLAECHFIIIHPTCQALRLQDVSSRTLRATQLISYFIAQIFLLVAFLQYSLKIACYHSTECGTKNERVIASMTPRQNDERGHDDIQKFRIWCCAL